MEYTPQEYYRGNTMMSRRMSQRKLALRVDDDVQEGYDEPERPSPEEEFFRLAVL